MAGQTIPSSPIAGQLIFYARERRGWPQFPHYLNFSETFRGHSNDIGKKFFQSFFQMLSTGNCGFWISQFNIKKPQNFFLSRQFYSFNFLNRFTV